MLNEKISYQIIRSQRKTMSLEIKPDGQIIVRAPLRLSQVRIRRFVEQKQEWILKNLEKIQKREVQRETVPGLSKEERTRLQQEACRNPIETPWNKRRMGLLFKLGSHHIRRTAPAFQISEKAPKRDQIKNMHKMHKRLRINWSKNNCPIQ